MPPGFASLEPQLLALMLAAVRPGAALLAAPLFGTAAVPLQLRVVLGLAVGLPVMEQAGAAMPAEGILSFAGLLVIAGEALAGLAIGFAVQIGFAAALIAGETIGAAMGLGFASMVDPSSGDSSTAVGQLLNMLATALFLCADGHLALIEIIATSFRTLPPGAAWLDARALFGLVEFGGLMFAAGLTIAMPVAAALILIQLVMATVARSAPALNLFAVGIPVTIIGGLVLLAVAAPVLASALDHVLRLGLDQASRLAVL